MWPHIKILHYKYFEWTENPFHYRSYTRLLSCLSRANPYSRIAWYEWLRDTAQAPCQPSLPIVPSPPPDPTFPVPAVIPCRAWGNVVTGAWCGDNMSGRILTTCLSLDTFPRGVAWLSRYVSFILARLESQVWWRLIVRIMLNPLNNLPGQTISNNIQSITLYETVKFEMNLTIGTTQNPEYKNYRYLDFCKTHLFS